MKMTRRLSHVLLPGLAVLTLLLALGATPAAADSITYNITVPNTALGALTPPYATVEVTLTSATTATVTFTSQISNDTLFVMGGANAAGVNVNASSWTIGGFSASNFESGFTPGPLSDGGSKNVSSFGVFNQTVVSFDGFTHSSTTISFVLTNTGGTWASAADVLAPNADGHVAEIHGFACTDIGEGASDCTSVIVTGFATDGGNPVPEPASIALFGSGLITLAGMIRRRRNAAKK
jgi:PEP-CTERM motif-containing protein